MRSRRAITTRPSPTTPSSRIESADDGEGLFAHFLRRSDVVRHVHIAGIDLGTRHELLDLDRMRALEPDFVEIAFLDGEIIVAIDLESLHLVLVLDDVARCRHR